LYIRDIQMRGGVNANRDLYAERVKFIHATIDSSLGDPDKILINNCEFTGDTSQEAFINVRPKIFEMKNTIINRTECFQVRNAEKVLLENVVMKQNGKCSGITGSSISSKDSIITNTRFEGTMEKLKFHGGNVLFDGVVVTGAREVMGTMFFSRVSNLRIMNSQILDLASYGYPSGLYGPAGIVLDGCPNVHFINTTFRDIKTGVGGCFKLINSVVRFNQCHFSNNIATLMGVIGYCEFQPEQIVMRGCTFENNSEKEKSNCRFDIQKK